MAAKAGHYESFYIKACCPGGGQGLWIRHTVHKRPGAEPNASIWFCLFDREAEGPRATKVTVPAADLSAPAGSWIRVAGAEIGPGRASGSVATDALTASWELTFDGDAEPCKYLPADWLYEAPVPAHQVRRPLPRRPLQRPARDRRRRSIELDGWPGMIGHNWGSEHAERWVWLEGTGFEGSEGTYFDAGAARIRIGSWTTPWVPSGMLVARRRAPPPRRLRQDPRRLGRGVGGRVRLRPARQGHRRPRPRLGPAQGLRRLGLRRPRRARAQHDQLLGRRPRADRRTPRRSRPASCGSPPAPPTSSGCGRPTTASRSSPTRTAEPGRSAPVPRRHWLIWVAVVPIVAWAIVRGFGLERGFPLDALIAYTPYVAVAALARRRGRRSRCATGPRR